MISVPESVLLERFELAEVRYKRTIRTFAYNCVKQLPDMTIEDISQELLMVLWRCVRNYDPDRGASFNTLFQGTAQRHVIGLVRAANVQKRGKGKITSLDPEAFALAVERMSTEGSAEDWYLAIAEHGERFAAELERAAS